MADILPLPALVQSVVELVACRIEQPMFPPLMHQSLCGSGGEGGGAHLEGKSTAENDAEKDVVSSEDGVIDCTRELCLSLSARMDAIDRVGGEYSHGEREGINRCCVKLCRRRRRRMLRSDELAEPAG